MFPKTILHIDFDSFFASVAQQYNPLLRGKPIGVTATNGRNCIIAASRQAKKLGIKSPSRTYDALRICPTIQFVAADFTLYWEISKKFISICKDYTPYVEIFSLDEVFMDVTHSAYLFGGVDNIIKEIREKLVKAIGEYITVSVGISHNKLLAKLASGMNKPEGLARITPENLDEIYQRTKLIDICGIGERINKRLENLGIHTFFQLRAASLAFLIAEFGNVEGRFLKNVSLGIDESPVVPYTLAPQVKSAGRNYCLPRNEYDERVVIQHFYELCEEVALKLRRLGKKARTIGFSLRGDVVYHGNRTYQDHIDSGKEIFYRCLRTISCEPPLRALHLENNNNYIRQISVWASNLTDGAYAPLSLFDTAMNNPKLLASIDTLNEKFGDHTIRNGFLLYAKKLTTVPNGFMADRYERTILASS